MLYKEPFVYVDACFAVAALNDYIHESGAKVIVGPLDEEQAQRAVLAHQNGFISIVPDREKMLVMHVELGFGYLGNQEWPCIVCEGLHGRTHNVFFGTVQYNWLVMQLPHVEDFYQLNNLAAKLQREIIPGSDYALGMYLHLQDLLAKVTEWFELVTVHRNGRYAYYLKGKNT